MLWWINVTVKAFRSYIPFSYHDSKIHSPLLELSQSTIIQIKLTQIPSISCSLRTISLAIVAPTTLLFLLKPIVSSQAKCIPILANGISPYLRTVHPQISNYLNGKLNMTPAEVDTLTRGLILTSYYITDALQTWESELKSKIKTFADHNETILRLMCIVSS